MTHLTILELQRLTQHPPFWEDGTGFLVWARLACTWEYNNYNTLGFNNIHRKDALTMVTCPDCLVLADVALEMT